MKWSIPERIIERGRAYVKQDRVLSIVPDYSAMVWHAEVLGTEKYHVELDGTTREKDVCECPYWQERGYCKHTVAVELALKKSGISRVLKEPPMENNQANDQQLTKAFTESFAKMQNKEIVLQEVTQSLRLEVFLESLMITPYHPERAVLGISFKIGDDKNKKRNYIVKNISDFLAAYQNEQTFSINAQHQFELTQNSFSKETSELLKQLVDIFRATQMVSIGGIQLSGKIDPRFILLPVNEAQRFLTKFVQYPLKHFKIGEHLYDETTFQAQQKMPIAFHVTKDSVGYRLIVESKIEYFWENYHWIFSENTIIPISAKQSEIYQMLQQLLKRMKKPEVYYAQTEVSDLFSFVLPMLRQIGEVVVDEGIQLKVIQAPMKAKILLRKKETRLQAILEFHYDELTLTSGGLIIAGEKENQLLIRDRKAEQSVIQVLHHLEFQSVDRLFEKRINNGAMLYRFFTSELFQLESAAEVILDESVRQLYLDVETYQPQIEVKDSGSWLDIHFDISGIETDEIDEIMKKMLNQEKFYQLKTGQILSLDSETFQKTSEALTQIRQAFLHKEGTFSVPAYAGLQVQGALNLTANTSYSQKFTAMVRDLTHPADFETPLPDGLNAELRSYQILGFRWLKMLHCYHFNGILADDMGLGKTLQMITYLLSEKEENKKVSPALVVAPASLIYNWQLEFKKFAPSMEIVVIAGSKKERVALIDSSGKADVYITSYAGLRQDQENYQQLELSCLVLDEAQMVKNGTTKTARAVKELKTEQRFALSGTPIENNLEELWSLFQMLMPGFFPARQQFKKMSVPEIAQMIQPFVLRREKKEVLKDLPEKIETNLYSSLTQEQKKVYLGYLKQMQKDVGGMDHDHFRKNRISILAGLTRLRQICCDPNLFLEDYTGESGKLLQVKELLVTAKENHRRVLLFSQFTSMLSKIEEELDALDISTYYLRGSTKPKDRIDMVEAFNAGEKDVFLISLKAGGTGLNLTGADTVILYDLWWNPAVEEQAAGRAHRIGQKKVVEVWRLIAEGTIEEKIYALQQEKKDLFKNVMHADDMRQLSQLTEEDIREILSLGLE